MISFDQFMKMEMRTAKVREAERVPNTDKLLKVVVDLAEGERQLVAGIAEVYEPEQLVGKTVIVVTNLEPATIMGVRSEGMLLAADVDGTPYVATFDEDVPAGARVR